MIPWVWQLRQMYCLLTQLMEILFWFLAKVSYEVTEHILEEEIT